MSMYTFLISFNEIPGLYTVLVHPMELMLALYVSLHNKYEMDFFHINLWKKKT